MAAFGTKKPGGDVAVQLTFPAVYSQVYADSGEGQGYMPSVSLAPMAMASGDDLQDAYHEQKRLDAHAMVSARGVSDRSADYALLHSHANYLGMPAPVLSQRRFANPSQGNLSSGIDSARRTMPGSTAPFRCLSGTPEGGESGGCGSCYETQMRGGVLRTTEGQRWAARKLQDRVGQLNAIGEAALSPVALDSGVGVEYPDVAAEFAPKAKLDLITGLDQIQNSLLASSMGSAVRFTLMDLAETQKSLIRFAVVANREELEQAYTRVEFILESVKGIAAQRAPGGAAAPLQEAGNRRQIQMENETLADAIIPRMEAMLEYLGKMLRGVNLQPKDRMTLSRSALKSSDMLRFTRGPPAAVAAAARAAVEGVVVPTVALDPRFERDMRQVRAPRAGAFMGEALGGDEGPERNPFRQGAAVGLRPVPEAAAPVFPRPGRRRAIPASDSDDYFTNEAATESSESSDSARAPPRAPSLAPRARAARAKAEAQAEAQAEALGAAVKRMAATRGAPGAAEAMADLKRLIAEKGKRDAKSDAAEKAKRDAKPPAKGKGKPLPSSLTRDTLPTTREGFVGLAAKLKGSGHNIRVNGGSQLKSIRANFIKRLGL